jgi:acetyltransferase-like isoleucine patch superfamily enzyme
LNVLLGLGSGILGRLTGLDPHGVEAKLRGKLWGLLRDAPELRVGRGVELVGPVERFRFGRGISLHGHSYFNANGRHGSIELGDRTHVDQFCVLYGQGGLRIGARCAIASGVIVYTQSNQYEAAPEANILDQPVRYAPVHIGDDVWIGAGAIILPGVTIGDHAVIGAGAVVRADVAPWSVVAGVPARRLRDRREPADPGGRGEE